MASTEDGPGDGAAFEPDGTLAGGGELGALMRATDWAATPLGPVENWPRALKTCVRILLTSRQPMWLGWGDELTYVYNDPYKAIIGGKHPGALGRPTSEVWREIWADIEPRIGATLTGVEGTYDEALLLIMERHGYPEETYYTFSYSPVPDDEGRVCGIFCANTDDTRRIIGERQLALLRELAASTAEARTIADACTLSVRSLETNPRDLPFALLYLAEPDGDRATLAGAAGIAPGHPAAPASIALDGPSPWPVAEVLRTHEACQIAAPDAALGTLPAGPWGRSPSQAVALPIASSGETGQPGVLIVGLNPYRLYDDDYARFLGLVAVQIAAALGNARAYQEERRRAEALAELDRAKTAFFANVSHEFRTPLTLLLGPLEDAIGAERDARQRASLETAHRNGLRLLRMVNTLLDFSRIEAGRVRASFAPTDLPALTADLASTFRSAVERAGLALNVQTPPLPPNLAVYIDREMWEQIVLNLLSNAFKFTFAGAITIATRPTADRRAVELTVRDSGTGIPEAELPRLFERFHRVQGARARTHEGTGIGLALVQELVQLHGGTIAVASEEGRGTAFTVTIPTGSAHLPPEQIGVARDPDRAITGAAAFVEEALRWLPAGGDTLVASDAPFDEAAVALPGSPLAGARVLLADDNADMRDYVVRLLRGRYKVEAVGDGEAALAAALAQPPDLVLTDVMMPRLDGFGLLRALRADPRTRETPVVLLSARAGEEARVEGLDSGADDYLVKPFSARELLARVGAHLALSHARTEATRREQAARIEAEQAVAARDTFLSIAAHELRTPVTSLKGAAQLLLRRHARGRLDAAQLEHGLLSLDRSADRLASLTDDLLDVARIRTGQLPLDRQPLDLVAVCDEALGAARNRVVGRHRLTLETAGACPPVLADAGRIEQVLTNLLDNAIKYSPDGGEIAVAVRADRAGVLVIVQDEGIGLPPGTAEAIFAPFGRAENAAASSLPGMGLGLFICRNIVERHGGWIRAESAGEGRGTTVTLQLPAADTAVAGEEQGG